MNSDVLLIAIIQPDDLSAATEELKRAGLWVTRIGSQGGFLRQPNCTLLMGMPRADVARATRIFAATCRKRIGYVNCVPDLGGAGGGAAWMSMPLEVEIGGATLFVCTIERHAHFLASVGGTPDAADPGAAPAPGTPASTRGGTMKLVLAIVAESSADALVTALTRERYQVTLISTTGGFLKRGNATLLIGVPPDRLGTLLKFVESHARAGEGPNGGVAFVLNTESHVRL